jgi:hypothetical protein
MDTDENEGYNSTPTSRSIAFTAATGIVQVGHENDRIVVRQSLAQKGLGARQVGILFVKLTVPIKQGHQVLQVIQCSLVNANGPR